MEEILFDGSFNGLLTVIYHCYKLKLNPTSISAEDTEPKLFSKIKKIVTDDLLAEKVAVAIKRKISPSFYINIQHYFYMGKDKKELLVLRLIKKIFSSKLNIENNLADTDTAAVIKTAKQINKEVHRMYAFVRFEDTGEGTFFAVIEPLFNVLPLISGFFAERYADQKWIIFDRKRSLGISYDRNVVSYFSSISELFKDASINRKPHDNVYTNLWRCYFNSVSIAERSNFKLQRMHMPKRYWKLLPELDTSKEL